MKPFIHLIATSIVALWVGAIALISVQNATPVTLQLFALQTVGLPFGLLLALTAIIGMVGTALLYFLVSVDLL
jgi:uncharacterized integral membrane protein